MIVPARERALVVPGWSAYLVQTMTGSVGPRLPLLGDAGVWTDGPLNDATSGQVKVPAAELLKYERHWWGPWSGSILVCFDGHPITLGPILNLPEQAAGGVFLPFGGLWSLLDHRIVTYTDYGDGEGIPLAESVVDYLGPSLGQIAADLVWKSMRRPNGMFPFEVRSVAEPPPGRQRTYEGFNVTNNSVGKRLREITEVIGGPDIAFRPEWVPGAEGSRVQWVMHHGTEGMPEIGQPRTFTLDLTAPKGTFAEPSIKAAASRFTRAYMSGEGEGAGTVMEIVSLHPSELDQFAPFLETAEGDSQAANPDLLRARGEGLVRRMDTIQITTEILAHQPGMPLWTWHTGDAMVVRVPDRWPQLPPGTYQMRVLSRSGTFTSNKIKIEFQTEVLIRG